MRLNTVRPVIYERKVEKTIIAPLHVPHVDLCPSEEAVARANAGGKQVTLLAEYAAHGKRYADAIPQPAGLRDYENEMQSELEILKRKFKVLTKAVPGPSGPAYEALIAQRAKIRQQDKEKQHQLANERAVRHVESESKEAQYRANNPTLKDIEAMKRKNALEIALREKEKALDVRQKALETLLAERKAKRQKKASETEALREKQKQQTTPPKFPPPPPPQNKQQHQQQENGLASLPPPMISNAPLSSSLPPPHGSSSPTKLRPLNKIPTGGFVIEESTKKPFLPKKKNFEEMTTEKLTHEVQVYTAIQCDLVKQQQFINTRLGTVTTILDQLQGLIKQKQTKFLKEQEIQQRTLELQLKQIADARARAEAGIIDIPSPKNHKYYAISLLLSVQEAYNEAQHIEATANAHLHTVTSSHIYSTTNSSVHKLKNISKTSSTGGFDKYPELYTLFEVAVEQIDRESDPANFVMRDNRLDGSSLQIVQTSAEIPDTEGLELLSKTATGELPTNTEEDGEVEHDELELSGLETMLGSFLDIESIKFIYDTEKSFEVN